jgi:serine phosphatase RsbU (regulator of sigma subunit)/tetratricopeptide (TPR) repeat protein
MYRASSLLFLLITLTVGAQEGLNKQELLNLLASDPPDSTRIGIYNELTWPVYSFEQPDSSIYYGEKAIKLGEALDDKKALSITHRRLGITYINLGDIQRSLRHQEESYHLSEEIGYKRGMLLALNNMGVAYLNNELLNTALGYFLRSLKLVEETKDYSSAANLYTNCGMIYRRTGDLQKSKEYFFRAKKYADVQNEPEMLLVANSNLSDAYRLLSNLDSSAYYLSEAGKYLNEQTGANTKFKFFLARALLRSAQGQNEDALKDFISMQSIVTVLSDEITLLINIGEQYLKTGNKPKALEFFQKAYKLSDENRMFNNLEYISIALANIYQDQGNLPQFAYYIRKHLAFADSNEQVNKVQQIQRQQLEYDYGRRHLADSILFQQKQRLNDLELQAAEGRLLRARNTRILLVVIMIILACAGVFVLNRFIVMRRQKRIIESQKQQVETKNEEILDSINYARRLQTAILPQMKDIKRYLNADVLFLPKDIIGGDFYFFEKHKSRIFFAVCDCTGHGIPGALMSVVCYEALEKAIRTFRLKTPAEVLDKAREIVIDTLQASDQNIKDGMDCSLLMIDQLRETVQWAGANNGLWLVKNGELTELKPDKQPVAFYESPKSFTNHSLQIEPGTSVYLFTDGYADQFGGYGAKKYKNKTLKKYLSGISDSTVDEQTRLLKQNFLDWKKDLDQVDDVAIAIVKF